VFKSKYANLLSRRVPGATLRPDRLHPGQAAQTERGRCQKVGLYYFFLLPSLTAPVSDVVAAWNNSLNPVFFVSDRGRYGGTW